MDLRPSNYGFFLFILFMVVSTVSANGVFKVQHKFAGMEQSVNAIRAHDVHRHRRFLYGIDVPLGGNGHPADTGLYFTKLGIGSPSKDYYVHVDTGSDIFWVNCIECTQCPKESSLHIDLTLYDPKASATGEKVTCDQDFCTAAAKGPIAGCTSNLNCAYSTVYADGSSSAGYFVRDVVQYNQVSGNLQTTPANGSVVFGCGAQQSGNLLSSNTALDGLLGFGRSNLSMISQLASSGKVKKIFTHCLSGVIGGGIFAIGQVVQPTVKTTPLIPNQLHYNVNLTAIEVGGVDLQLPTNVFETSDRKGTIIDSGTTLAYLSKEIYEPLMSKIMSQHSDLQLQIVEDQVSCFQYTQSVDDGFPNVTFHFENSLSLLVYPHDYLFQLPGYGWCIGWQDSGNLIEETKELTILGDLVLSNKLVIYDLELQTIGWTEYDCSSNITLKDENSGAEYLVAAHDLSPTSSAWSWDIGRLTQLLLLTTILHHINY